MNRRVSDRTMQRWLRTGRPPRVTRLIGVDPRVAARLDALSRLTNTEAGALGDLATPSSGFEHRTRTEVQRRIESSSGSSTILDLFGLGIHVGKALLGDTSAHVDTPESGSRLDKDDEIDP